jgi:RNA polymerase sigma-70 factor (ECF subfamily)
MDFESLYQRYARDVYRFALYLSGRQDVADDISAETFVRAWTSPQPIREGTVKAYLFAIARNLYRADRRHQARVEPISDLARSKTPSPEESTAVRRLQQRAVFGSDATGRVNRG